MTARSARRWRTLAVGVAVGVVAVAWFNATRSSGRRPATPQARDRAAERTHDRAGTERVAGREDEARPVAEATLTRGRGARARADDGPGRTIHVRVVQSDCQDCGIPRAEVRAERVDLFGFGSAPFGDAANADGATRTGPDGRGIVGRVPRGAAVLRATAADYVAATRTVQPTDDPLAEVVIPLTRGVGIAGTVVKADGTLAGGAVVRCTQGEGREVVADAQGGFRMSGFLPSLVAVHAIWRDEDAVVEGDSTVEGGTLDAVIRLRAEPTRRRIHLRVRGADGVAVTSATWHAKDEEFLDRHGDDVEGEVEDGEAILAPDPRVQWISIESPRDAEGKALAWAPVLVGPLGDRGGDLDVVLPRAVALIGTVRDDEGTPLEGVAVNVMPVVDEGSGEHYVYEDWWFAKSDAQGRFRVEGVGSSRVQVDAQMSGGTNWPKTVVTAPCDPLELVVRRRRVLRGSIRHPDGSPAPEGVLFRWGTQMDSAAGPWNEERVRLDATFEVWTYGAGRVRLRAGLAPTGPEELAVSEVTADAAADHVELTIPHGTDVVVHLPDWPAGTPGRASLSNGSTSRAMSAWIEGSTARFDGVDGRVPLAFYCGPLPDGRIGFAPDLLAAGRNVTVPLMAGRAVRGRARGAPASSRPEAVWADAVSFESVGELGADGAFRVQGIPPGACRVCVVFRSGREFWCGSVRNSDSTEAVDIEVSRKSGSELLDWLVDRR